MAWVITPLTIDMPLGVTAIEIKPPAYLKTCTGVAVSVVSENNPAQTLPLGILSLSFNNKASHPVHVEVCDYPNVFDKQPEIYPLEESLRENTIITGYYEDLERCEIPYQIKIYLRCKK